MSENRWYGKWSRCILLILLVVIVIWVGCRFWPGYCLFCPQPDPGPDPEARIVIDDPYQAVWMPLDNAFAKDELGILDMEDENGTAYQSHACKDGSDTQKYGECKDNYSDSLRTGIEIQIGEAIIDNKRGSEDYFGGIVLTFLDGSEVRLGKAAIDADDDAHGIPTLKFDWLDINPVGELCAMDAFHAYSLFQNEIVGTECDVPKVDPAALDVKANCEFSVDPATDTELKDNLEAVLNLPDSCLRRRTLHAGLDPNYALVTYWSGDNHFTIRETNEEGDEHVEYRFDLMDAVTVDHWDDGCFVARYSDVTEIRLIASHGGATHDIIIDPPTDGGRISYPPDR